MIGLKTGTWVLIADGEKALFLENVGDTRDMNLKVLRKTSQENPSTTEQGTDRPGRMGDGPSGHRSAVQDTDWHALGKRTFARDLAQMLYQRAHQDRFGRLVVVAAPEVLGALRAELHPEVRTRVVAELPKTLTSAPIDEIESVLAAEFV